MGDVRTGVSKRRFGFGKRALFCGAAIALAMTPVMRAHAETLADAMSLAYEGNPNLRAARAQLRATDENVAIAVSGWRPTLTVTGSVTRQQQDSFTPGLSGTGATGGLTSALGLGNTVDRTSKTMLAQVSEPLFRGFRTVASTAQAKFNVMAQRARLEQSESSILLQVATSYFDVLQNEAVLELNRNNAQYLERNLEAQNDRFRVGEITRTDVAQSEASLASAKAAVVQAEGDLQRVRAAYENVVGKPAETLTQPSLPGNLPKVLDEAITVAINDNPNYVASDFTARAQKENITVVQSNLLPSVSLVGSYSKQWDATVAGSTAKVVSGGINVTVPLYQGGAEWAQLRQSKDTWGQYVLLADQARLDARTGATTAWESLAATTASLDSYNSQIQANQIALEGVRREQEVGSRTVLDVLNAEQTLLNSQVLLVRTQHDQLVASYQLLSAMGKLTAGDLGLGVKLYDPKHHYDAVRGQWIGTNSDTANDLKQRGPVAAAR